MQQKCEDSDEYESTMVLKRVVDTDEEEKENVEPKVSEKITDENKEELYKLTNLALKQIPHSPKQKATIEKINKIGTIKHTYSHYKITITLIECQPTNINVKNSKWVKIDEINNYTFSKANHKLFNTIGIIND